MEENPVGFIQKYHKSLFEKLASDDSATVQAAISEFIYLCPISSSTNQQIYIRCTFE